MDVLIEAIRTLAHSIVDISGIGPKESLDLDGPKYADIYLFIFSSLLSCLGTIIVGATAWFVVTRGQQRAAEHENAIRRREYINDIQEKFEQFFSSNIVHAVLVKSSDFIENPQITLDNTGIEHSRTMFSLDWHLVKEFPPVMHWMQLTLGGKAVNIMGSSDELKVEGGESFFLVYLIESEACAKVRAGIVSAYYGLKSGILTEDEILLFSRDVFNVFCRGVYQSAFGLPSMSVDEGADSIKEWYTDKYRSHIMMLCECIEIAHKREKNWAIKHFTECLHPVAAYLAMQMSPYTNKTLTQCGYIADEQMVTALTLVKNRKAGSKRARPAYFFDNDDQTLLLERDIKHLKKDSVKKYKDTIAQKAHRVYFKKSLEEQTG